MRARRVKSAAAAALAIAICAGSVSINIRTDAAVIYQPGIGGSSGPGSGSGSISSVSADAGDYASTGGVATGSMTISTVIPAGCIDSMALDLNDPIVETRDLYSYEDVAADLSALLQAYPSYLSVSSLGTTADARGIYLATVGNTKASTKILVTGAIHAREYITSLLVMKELEYLLRYADTGCFDGKSLKSWLSDTCVYFVPMVNPDGVAISEQGLSGIRSESLRATILEAYANDLARGYTTADLNSYLVRWKANARGVNLNDNFNAMTGYLESGSDAVSYSYYYGTPASEAETRALQSLADSTHFKAVINYHSTGSVIYWDNTGNTLTEHCRDLANNVFALTGYSMVRDGADGGSFKAYLATRSNPVTNITVEVGVGSAPVSIGEFGSIWAKNKAVVFYAMKWAKEKGK